ncbi:tyrosine-type recombinase/integrase [Roseibium sediminicola]|uniref:Tyrosine-type recombinase/integrase n=1 Tax=Roseibium sediminicola TaxID=2933272 RepID=A0ABT0H181_9HYPH|nr:tyrosine-type recombinase/integrase [Roseibium sp. CAU 1639]MCK7615225.1 tyrosine-type recombinase/integrase [Roseibium sp. CAU 1639]
MAGKIRYFHEDKNGYFARRRVPTDIKDQIGKEFFMKALGTGKREAIEKLPAALVEFQATIDDARKRRLASRENAGGSEVEQTPFRQLTANQIAAKWYLSRIESDNAWRNSDARYARQGTFDEDRIQTLKSILAGTADDNELLEAFGDEYRVLKRMGHATADAGTQEWRSFVRTLASGELERLRYTLALDEGTPPPEPPKWLAEAIEQLKKPAPTETALEPVSIRLLFERWRKISRGSDEETSTCRRYRPAIESLIAFVGHNDAQRITNKDVAAWVEHLINNENKAHSTVKKVHLTAVSGMLHWASDNGLIEPVQIKTRLKIPRQQLNRSKGYTEEEVTQILRAAQAYAPSAQSKESMHLSNAKRWLPWLIAFTGARIGELAQLRKEDVSERDGIRFLLLTPEAGTIKSGQFREVPLHPQLIELGFLKFVDASKSGPLFHGQAKNGTTSRQPAENTGKRLAAWLRAEGLTPDGVAPNHGFRHRFKTISIELGLPGRVVDAMQGHASGRAADNYGDVTLAAKFKAVAQLPSISLQ